MGESKADKAKRDFEQPEVETYLREELELDTVFTGDKSDG